MWLSPSTKSLPKVLRRNIKSIKEVADDDMILDIGPLTAANLPI
jgi:hypothetical protein